MTPTILRFAIVALLSASVSLQAQALDSQSKIDLQSALLNFLELTSDGDGLFRVIDRDSGEPLEVYAGAMHPKIVPLGEGQVLCIEMFDSAGGRHDADFVMRRTDAGWIVVDVLVNQRPLLKKAMSRSK